MDINVNASLHAFNVVGAWIHAHHYGSFHARSHILPRWLTGSQVIVDDALH